MAEPQVASAAPVAAVGKRTPDQAAKRPPGVEAADNPEWSMRFLAKVYGTASKHKPAVEDLPNWFYPRPEVDQSGAISYPHNQLRDRILEEVVNDLIAKRRLAEQAAPTA